MLGDEARVLTGCQSCNFFSEHPLAQAVLIPSRRKAFAVIPVENFRRQLVWRSKVKSTSSWWPEMVTSWRDSDGSGAWKRMVELKEQWPKQWSIYSGWAKRLLDCHSRCLKPAQKKHQKLKERGWKTVMLTGDNEWVAQAITKVELTPPGCWCPSQEKARHPKTGKKLKVAFDGITMPQLSRSRMWGSLWDRNAAIESAAEAAHEKQTKTRCA